MRLKNLLPWLLAAGVTLSGTAVRPAPVALDSAIGDENDEPRWVQCAMAGEFKGHSTGAFKFDRSVFEQLIKNFRAHPAYKNPKSKGVIPFDFHHAAEASPSEVADKGAPAQGWALDLEVRQGANGDELWVLANWLEPAKTYIREGRYQWLSVAVWPKARDAKTGAEVGWYMSSIALTNDPFIQGMQPITAGYMHDPYSRPSTPEDVLECVVEIFDLPWSSSRADVMAELDKLESAVRGRGGDIPASRVSEVVGALAQCLNLPVLTPGEDVVRSAQKLIGQATQPAALATTRRKTDMSLIVKLAATLGIANSVILAARDDDPKSQAALEFEVERELEGVLLERKTVKESHKALLEALNVADDKAATPRVVDLLKKEGELAELQPAIEQAKKDKEEAEAKAIEDDVTAVVEAQRLPKSVIPALRLHRKTDPADFAKNYPLPPPGMRHITKTLTSGDRQERGADGIALSRAPQTPKDLQEFPGRNDVERAINCVRSKPGGDKLSWEDVNVRANEMLHELRGG